MTQLSRSNPVRLLHVLTIASSLILSVSCNSPTNPNTATASNCRAIPSAATFTFTSEATVRTAKIRCIYDRTRNVLECNPTTVTADCSAIYSATYRNIDDFIEEGHVVGKLNATAQTGLGLGDVCSDGAFDASIYTYDSQHRLVTAQTPSSSATFANWDSRGRPRTQVQASGGPFDCAITSDLVYDDSARTLRSAGQTATTCSLPLTVVGKLSFLSLDLVDRRFETTTTFLIGGNNISVPMNTTLLSDATEQVCR